MKDDFHDFPDEPAEGAELEARIVAWVLGEASAFEAAELERRCADDPALREFERRMREVHGLIGGDFAVKPEENWRLPEEKRSRITDLLGVEETEGLRREKTARYFGRRMLLAAAACVALTLIAWPMFMVQKMDVVAESRTITNYMAPAYDAAPSEARSKKEGPDDFGTGWGEALASPATAAADAKASEAMESQEGLDIAGVEIRRRGEPGVDEVRLRSLIESRVGEKINPERLDDEIKAQYESGLVNDVSIHRERDGDGVKLTYDIERRSPMGGAPGKPADEPIPASGPAREFDSRGTEGSDIAGLRSGDGAIDRNTIDAILNNPGRGGAASDAFAAPADAAPESAMRGMGGLRRDLVSEFPAQRQSEVAAGSEISDLPQMGKLAKELENEKAPLPEKSIPTGGRLFQTPADAADSPARNAYGYSSLAQKETIRRQNAVVESDRLRDEGREAYARGDYKQAHDRFAEAQNLLPDAPMVQERRHYLGIIQDDAAYALGEQYRKAGKYEEARELAQSVLERDLDNESAKRLKDSIDDPTRTNPALTHEHAENVDKVRRMLYLAEGNYNLGKFDEAKCEYENVIRIDPYNKAARRGLERIAQASADYYRAANDHTRAELLAQMDAAWELPVLRTTLAGEIEALRELSEEERMAAMAGWDLPDNILRVLYPQYLEAKSALEKARSEGGDESQSLVKAVEERVAGMKKDLDRGVADLLRRVGVDLEEMDGASPDDRQLPQSGKELKPAEIETASEPFSTFSLHVSDASFRLAGAAMERGERPAAESVRVEEFYNAFDYGDPAPLDGEPVACAIEQSAHPALPQRNLVRIGVRTGAQGRGGATPLNLTLLLDSSGSMEREDRREGLARAVESLAGLLKEGDTVTVASFARQPRLLADRLPGAEAERLSGIIAGTPSEGGTNLEEGLKLAGELAQRQFKEGAQNRIVLFTDGAANLGDAEPESLQAMVEGFRQRGIAFDAAGFGTEGLNDRLLERLTRNGNGRYYVVDGPEDAEGGFAAKLAGAFRPAAEDVKVQVRFNPGRVARYRLIGFEEHRLAKEDFRDDSVDAAEMAAEEAGNALYQIEVLPQGEGDVGEVSVRFRDAGSGEMVERSWTIPYEERAAGFDEARPSLQLAGLAALVAGKLRGEVEMVDLGELAPVMARVRERYAGSEAVEALGRMFEGLR